MLVSPSSGRPQFEGYAAFHEERVAPFLADREIVRRRAVNEFAMIIAASAVAAVLLGLLLPFGDSNAQFAVIAFAMLAIGAGARLEKTRREITHGLLERITAKFGFTYRGSIGRPGFATDFMRLKLLPQFNREEWEDEVAGDYSGVEFRLCEAHLKFKTSGKRSSTRTVFRGQLLAIDYPKRFAGSTILLRDAGLLNVLGKPSKSHSRVGLGSLAFEKAFEAWSTDQVEAHDLLDPVVLERFMELERLFGGKKLRAAFDGGKLLIAIETGDRLSLGTMFSPIDSADRANRILKEFDLIFDLIDVAVSRVSRPLKTSLNVRDVRSN